MAATLAGSQIHSISEYAMQYRVDMMSVTGTPLLVVRRRATQAELSKVVPDGCGVVWNFIRRAGIDSPGRNVAVYLNGRIDLEVGVEVGADAAAAGEVMLSATPAGTVATTTHLGPYSRLHEAHEAILQWSRANQRRMAGPSWEVYGHWTDDTTKLRTDVFYLVTAADTAAG